ncbi:hypothetical protein A3836_01295 [Staphylococcus hominis]|uniref:hypothetical protein n=1 Tax=Staphylococcus hominis TaxID=1290 RepID=UPI0007DA01BD|nr:hypothetical protein [Staphylococcus hominis]OAO07831.1 hypothetical protein A3836_01295 [Staphylococcus hominis]
MVKIKRKVEMTLPELITWAWKNDVNKRTFTSSNNTSVSFSKYGGFVSTIKYVFKDETFSVEIEEKITEETVLPELVELSKDGGGAQWSQKSIDVVKNSFSKEFWLKDGDTMTLIWKDGELVGDE